ncbi:hypothetical protein CIHG_02770 [Coccidioides immitis H538.4]|uniref:Stress response protein NST1 n=1 Tax=Coccidioides immitis H538.4 TaxID=396776 RepID=A0A0J8RJH6_COCIT|nr:hypothetical protein CIHG_02770 [Coccidioides immitis H538.4]
MPAQNGDGGHDIVADFSRAATQGQHAAFDNDDLDYTDDETHYSTQGQRGLQHDKNGVLHQSQEPSKRKGKKKKNRKSRSQSHQAEGSSTSMSTPSASLARPVTLPPLSSSAYRSAHKVTKDRIWNTSTHEERERIKEFWLQLGEEERRSLVKVEKEAVLRKMKEQQKHSCSCTVCGRKRTAIEEELEVLYDAYYEELEQYANHKQGSFENGAPIGAPPRLYQPPLRTLDRHSHHPVAQHPSRGRVQELPDDDEDLDDDYDEDDEDDYLYSEDELEDAARTTRADFFAFGNSLTVKDGILTVADELLKTDWNHFIDLKKQFAERRTRKKKTSSTGDDAMTEEQRMEEGRRMFQIFAARMFEQRVLTAYREKIARERQERLIEELEEENRLDVEREAKKAREAQKRKDKKKLQKQAKEEERAKREAERAAEEAAQKALEEKRLEEQRRKKEEQRKKREAEKKAQEEERQRKEAERQKRLKEERERQAEFERKQREQKEREKKKREEAKKREREEKEAKERELREKKIKEERERREREEKARQEKEAAAKAERESREKAKREEQAAQQAAAQAAAVQAAKRASQSGPTHLPPGLQHPQGPSALQSPHFQVATPVVPKAPTPIRPRQPSQQGSHASSPRSQPAHVDISQTSSLSPGSRWGPRMPMPHDMSMYTNHSGASGRTISWGLPLQTVSLSLQESQDHDILVKVVDFKWKQPSISFERNQHETQPQSQPISRPAPIQRPASTVPHDQHKDESKTNQQEIDELSTQLGSSALLDDSDIPLTAPPSQPLSSALPPGLPGAGRIGFAGPSLFSDHLGSSKPHFSLGAPGSGAGWAHNPFGSPGFPAAPSWGPSSGAGWPTNAFGILGGSHRAHTSRPVAIRLSVIQACKQLNTTSGTDSSGYHNVNQILRQVEQLNSPNESQIGLDEMLDICDTEGNPQNGRRLFYHQE